jgi:hypothetical protein
MSKKNNKNKKTDLQNKKNDQSQTLSRKLTTEEAAVIIKNRLANRPVVVWRYPNSKWNKKFIITLAAMLVALAAGLYFLSRTS